MHVSLKTPLRMCLSGLDLRPQPNKFSNCCYLEIGARVSAFALSILFYVPAIILASLGDFLKKTHPIELPSEILGPGLHEITNLIHLNSDLKTLASARFGEDCATAAFAIAYNIGNKISFISLHVMVGSEIQAASKKLLEELNISLVVNIAGDYQKQASRIKKGGSCNFFKGETLNNGIKIRYIEGDIADTGLTPLPLTELVGAINQEIQSGGRVLIHCEDGKSRTGAVAIAWIMFSERKNFTEAFNLLKKRRHLEAITTFIPTPTLLEQLKRWNPKEVRA